MSSAYAPVHRLAPAEENLHSCVIAELNYDKTERREKQDSVLNLHLTQHSLKVIILRFLKCWKMGKAALIEQCPH